MAVAEKQPVTGLEPHERLVIRAGGEHPDGRAGELKAGDARAPHDEGEGQASVGEMQLPLDEIEDGVTQAGVAAGHGAKAEAGVEEGDHHRRLLAGFVQAAHQAADQQRVHRRFQAFALHVA